MAGTCHVLVLLLNAWLAASQGFNNRFMIPQITLPNRYRSLTTEEPLFPPDVEEFDSGSSLSYGRNTDWYTPMTMQNPFSPSQQYQVTELTFYQPYAN